MIMIMAIAMMVRVFKLGMLRTSMRKPCSWGTLGQSLCPTERNEIIIVIVIIIIITTTTNIIIIVIKSSQVYMYG